MHLIRAWVMMRHVNLEEGLCCGPHSTGPGAFAGARLPPRRDPNRLPAPGCSKPHDTMGVGKPKDMTSKGTWRRTLHCHLVVYPPLNPHRPPRVRRQRYVLVTGPTTPASARVVSYVHLSQPA
jgi:hypothetical protein